MQGGIPAVLLQFEEVLSFITFVLWVTQLFLWLQKEIRMKKFVWAAAAAAMLLAGCSSSAGDVNSTETDSANKETFFLWLQKEIRMKKFVWAAAAAAMLLAGCSSSAGDVNSTETDSANKETFTVGMECNYAPFNWQTTEETETSSSLGAAGYCDGYDVVVSKAIADDLGRELVVKKIDWDGLQPALESGQIDAIVAGMTASDEREEGIDFTTPYYGSEMVMIVKKGSDAENFTDIQQFSGYNVIGQASDEREEGIDFTTPYYGSEMVMIVKKGSDAENFTDIQQFSGYNVIGQKNTNYDTVIDQIEGVNHITPKGKYPELILSLQSGEADAITAELPVAKGIVASNPDLTYITFDEGKGFDVNTTVSIGMKNDTRDTDFFKAVQAALDKIDQETRDEWMVKAVENAPTGE